MQKEKFFKKSVLKSVSYFHRKTPVLDSRYNKVAFRPAKLLKVTPAQVFSCEICKIFKNSYFKEHLQTIASVYGNQDLENLR